jgi:hypothetical protein
MKYASLFAGIVFLLCTDCLLGQPVGKKAYGLAQRVDDGVGQLPVMGSSGMPMSSHPHSLRLMNTYDLTSPTLFPYQDMYMSYSESFPALLSNGQVLMAWASTDTLYTARSSDGGLTWGNRTALKLGVYPPRYLVGQRTNTGRLIAVWLSSFVGLQCSYSDNNGLTWSLPTTITSNGTDSYTTISQTSDGKLWLFYSRSNPSTSYDIYYRTSTNNGITWSSEQVFLATTFDDLYGTVVSGNGCTLLAFYEDNSSGNYDIYRRSSTDGGATWSTPAPVANSSLSEVRPRVLRQADGTLWLIYQVSKPTIIPDYLQWDIYYTTSTDGGNSWSEPVQFTKYAGYDAVANADLVNNQPFVSFASTRWNQFQQPQLWYGIIGVTQDSNPPPTLLRSLPSTPSGNIPISIQAYVADETGVSRVLLLYTLNAISFGSIQMYDDGLHNDGSAGDNIWGTSIGPFQFDDQVSYSFWITDLGSNTLDVSGGSFQIPATHNAGSLIMSFYSNSQLAEEGNFLGTSAYWPRSNGQDYLYMGGLWVAASVGGENRVMNRDYYESDWRRTPGTPFSVARGVSDQDGDVTYDDSFAQSRPIGLQVHQQSYQWSTFTRDDFVIFSYTLKNITSGVLNNVSVALWLDPDVTAQTSASDDLGGYDSSRSLIYMYDSKGNPAGYIGLRLLGFGATPGSAKIYTYDEEPRYDFQRYQIMTSGIVSPPTTPADYRMLLTAQPFTLAVNQTRNVAFGIVMGNGLAELQANADTMQAIYQKVLVTGVEETRAGEIPREYSLEQNYPNPFNPSTTIRFSLPKSGYVTLKVYDILGREVETLVEGVRTAGFYSVEWTPKNLASGVYLYRIQAGAFSDVKRLLLLK